MTDSWVLPGTLAATAIGSAYYLSQQWKTAAITAPAGASYECQAKPVKGQPGVFKCGYLDDDVDTVAVAYPEVNTLYDVFLRGLEVSNNGECLGRRGKDGSYEFVTYTDVFRGARDLGAALIGHMGLQPSNDVHVGIYCRNCPEWMTSALACVQQSIVVVPLYDTLGAEAATFIVQQTEISVIIVDNAEKASKLIENAAQMPTLKHIVVVDAGALTPEMEQQAKESSIAIETFANAVREGQLAPQKMHLPSPEDTYIICYTSGTTGLPKGVILTHANLLGNISAFVLMLNKFCPDAVSCNEVHISYLPLSHMMEQMSHWAMLIFGAKIGYFSGSIPKLTDDIQALRPTVFPVVPRLLNRFYDAIHSKLSKAGPVGKAIFNFAYQRKLAELKQGVIRNDSVWDRLVFGKIQAQVGGRVGLMATGSAPISAEVLETCRVAMGAKIIEAYGQTECTAMATCTWPGDWMGGHCGGPAPCSLIKLADVPELNYWSKDGKGEVMVKGPSVTKGYFRDEAKTAELFDEDGFLHTGDIGQMLPNGTIKIIDRKKHIFKLAQGEYVAPEKIENVYIRAEIVQQVYVDGDSLQRWLIAVVVPETKPLMEWAEEHGISGSLEEICQNDKAKEFVLSELQKIGKENKLNSIEQVKKVHLAVEPFSVENGLLTPTLKAKRPQLRQTYKPVMDAIYKQFPNL